MRRRKNSPALRARVFLQCRLADSHYLDGHEAESGRPRVHGNVTFFSMKWPIHWFDPSSSLLRFPYLGGFESEVSRLWFACDGHEVASFQAWLPSLEEMRAVLPTTATGEVDSERAAAFNRYLETRTRAVEIINGVHEYPESRHRQNTPEPA